MQTGPMIDASAAVQSVTVSVARSVPADAEAVGFAVAEKGPVPRQLGLSRAALKANGFEGKSGQVLSVPTAVLSAALATGPSPVAVWLTTPPSDV